MHSSDLDGRQPYYAPLVSWGGHITMYSFQYITQAAGRAGAGYCGAFGGPERIIQLRSARST